MNARLLIATAVGLTLLGVSAGCGNRAEETASAAAPPQPTTTAPLPPQVQASNDAHAQAMARRGAEMAEAAAAMRAAQQKAEGGSR